VFQFFHRYRTSLRTTFSSLSRSLIGTAVQMTIDIIDG
jgi:hypothetical protein